MSRKNRIKATWKVVKAYNNKGIKPEAYMVISKLAKKFGLKTETIKDYIETLKKGIFLQGEMYKIRGRYKLEAFKRG